MSLAVKLGYVERHSSCTLRIHSSHFLVIDCFVFLPWFVAESLGTCQIFQFSELFLVLSVADPGFQTGPRVSKTAVTIKFL